MVVAAYAPLPHVAGSTIYEIEDPRAGFSAKVTGAIPVDPEWSRAYADMLRASLCLFASDILKIELASHILEWEQLVQTERRIGIIAARDHSKSSVFSYAYPIWRAWSEPGCETYVFSRTLDQAMEHLDIIINGRNNLKGMLATPVLESIVPETGGARNGVTRLKRTDVKFKNGSRIRAIGYGKAVRGAHPKYIVLDDPLNDDSLWSEITRKKDIEYFKSAITNMLMPDGQLILVGTPYHIADLWGFIRANKMYTFRKYPGIIKKNGKERPLFPWRWPLKKLRDKREEIGAVAFAREILCEAITDDIAIFPPSLFPPCFDKTLTCRPTRKTIRERGWSVFLGVDIARSASVAADYFVIFVIGVDRQGTHYIIDIIREKGLPFNRQQELIKLTARRYGADLIFIESNNMQQVWSDEVIRTTDLPVKPFQTRAQNKYPLDKGVPSLRILLENGKIGIPRGDEYSIKITDEWITEATQFGFIEGKLTGIGEHDDIVMAWWFAVEASRHGGFSFAFGEDEDIDENEMTGGKGNWEEEMLGSDADDEESEDFDGAFDIGV